MDEWTNTKDVKKYMHNIAVLHCALWGFYECKDGIQFTVCLYITHKHTIIITRPAFTVADVHYLAPNCSF